MQGEGAMGTVAGKQARARVVCGGTGVSLRFAEEGQEGAGSARGMFLRAVHASWESGGASKRPAGRGGVITRASGVVARRRSPKGGGQIGERICTQQLLRTFAHEGGRRLIFAFVPGVLSQTSANGTSTHPLASSETWTAPYLAPTL